MIFNLDETAFIELVKKITQSKKINLRTKNQIGYAFNVMDEIHPAWAGFLAMTNLSDPDRMILSKMHNHHREIMNFTQWQRISTNKKYAYEQLKKWNISFFDIWSPFAETTLKSVKDSLADWSFVEKKIFIDTNALIEMGFNLEEAEEHKKLTYNFLKSLFMYHGELYANSRTHGFHKDENVNIKTLMTSFISISNLLNKQNSGSKGLKIKLFHADFGMQFLKNLEINKPELKAKGMNPQQMLKWALTTGNSAKNSDDFPIRGLGSAMIKSLIAFHNNASAVCYTGNYIIRMKKAKTFISDDMLKLFLKEGILNHIDDLVEVDITFSNDKFPGTAWMLSLEVESINHVQEHEEIKEVIAEKQNSELKIIKEFLYEEK